MGGKDKTRGETEKEVGEQSMQGRRCLRTDIFSTFSSTTEPGPRLVIEIQMYMYKSYSMLFKSQKVNIILHLTNNQQSFYLVFL